MEAFDPRLVGEQLSDVGVLYTFEAADVPAETLFRVAVTVELWVAVRVPVVALKVD